MQVRQLDRKGQDAAHSQTLLRRVTHCTPTLKSKVQTDRLRLGDEVAFAVFAKRWREAGWVSLWFVELIRHCIRHLKVLEGCRY